ncbi:MAG: protein BatD [Candidatus Coatesbacteria bacterium]|nr:protein BatD [Candidatus Coatesbacteria bacterium]
MFDRLIAHRQTAAFALFLALFLAGASSASAQSSIEASVSEKTIFIDDQITLIITAKGIDGEIQLPDMSSDFSIISQSKSQSMTIINMQVEATATYQYILQPEKVGVLSIPPIRAKADDKTVTTKRIQVEVLEHQSRPQAKGPSQGDQDAAGPTPQTAGDETIFIETSADKKEVYLGEQLTMTFRLFSRHDLGSADYTAPTCTNFWKEDIENRRRYATLIKGKRYRVEEISTALFPTKTGELTIGSASLKCTLDTFFSPNFAFGRRGVERPRNLQTQPITINVKPLPDGAPPDFSGAVGQFSISASVEPSELEVGKSATLNVRIWGTGNVKTIQELPKPSIEHLDVYEPNIKESVSRKDSPIRGTKSFEFVLVPNQPGDYVIPAFAFSYFDPETSRYRTAKTRPIKLTVTGTAQVASPGETPSLTQRTDVQQTGIDIRFIKPKMTEFKDYRQDLHKRAITLILVLLPGLVAIGLCFKGALSEKLFGDRRLRTAKRDAYRLLSEAKTRMNPDEPKEFYSLLAKSLIDYIGARFGVPTPGISATTVGGIISSSGDGDKAGLLASECIEVCDFYRFSAQKSSIDEMKGVMAKVWQALSLLQHLNVGKEN